MRTDKWITLEEVAAYSKLSLVKLYRMDRKGEIPASKIGAQWRFDCNEIDEWMKTQRPEANGGLGNQNAFKEKGGQ